MASLIWLSWVVVDNILSSVDKVPNCVLISAQRKISITRSCIYKLKVKIYRTKLKLLHSSGT